MSRWTGKSDFGDSVEMGHVNIDILDLYVDGIGPIRINSKEDLIPYYTHLVGSAGCSEDHQVYNLTRESYITIEEQSLLKWRVELAKRVWNSFKRKNKRTPTYQEFAEKVEAKFGKNTEGYIWKYFWECLNDKKDEFGRAHLKSYNLRRAEFIQFAFRHHKGAHPMVTRLIWDLREFDTGDNWEHEVPLLNTTKEIWETTEV